MNLPLLVGKASSDQPIQHLVSASKGKTERKLLGMAETLPDSALHCRPGAIPRFWSQWTSEGSSKGAEQYIAVRGASLIGYKNTYSSLHTLSVGNWNLVRGC